ncbi:cellulase family glycosylhydrolase [Candidatus Saccharibacteria bacterium]|nr:MAG: cellulase family glycosylhydrolase [Candidatus Saccharibacteria bacterium]
MTRALCGVNLGGWLVLERWMTPSLFEGTSAVDEYTFMQTPGAREKIRHHQKTFITEADWHWMAANGIEAVRIPVGYWILEGEAPYVSSIGRLDWAFTMAAKYRIKLLLCLHGAPGGQNGRDHSGRIGRVDWYRTRQLRMQTIDILEELAHRYRDEPEFWGLELLNEPRPGLLQWKLRLFYNQAYRRLRSILRPTTQIVFHDAFTPRLLSGAIIGALRNRVTMDIHWYHFTFWAHKWLPLRYYYPLVHWHGRLIIALRCWQNVIVGEWNGIIAGEILDKVPTSGHAAVVREHVRRQLQAYATADAWFYWSYKTDDRGVYHFRSMIEDGEIVIGN